MKSNYLLHGPTTSLKAILSLSNSAKLYVEHLTTLQLGAYFSYRLPSTYKHAPGLLSHPEQLPYCC